MSLHTLKRPFLSNSPNNAREIVSYLRWKLGMSQREFANLVHRPGVKWQDVHVSLVERGKKHVMLDAFILLSESVLEDNLRKMRLDDEVEDNLSYTEEMIEGLDGLTPAELDQLRRELGIDGGDDEEDEDDSSREITYRTLHSLMNRLLEIEDKKWLRKMVATIVCLVYTAE